MVCIFCQELIEFPSDIEIAFVHTERCVCTKCFRQIVDAEPVMSALERQGLLRRMGVAA